MNKKQIAEWQKESNRIINEVDYKAMFDLQEDRDFGFVLSMILHKYHDLDDLRKLPHSHKVLFLCKLIEDYCQADFILNFFEEDFSRYSEDAYNALIEFNAPLSAKAFNEVRKIVSENTGVMNHSEDISAEISDKLNEYDSIICNYSDGHFSKLYREYAEKNRSDFQ